VLSGTIPGIFPGNFPGFMPPDSIKKPRIHAVFGYGKLSEKICRETREARFL